MRKILFIVGLLFVSVFAKNVQIKHNDLILNANYKKANNAKSIYLITHGTLAHNKMEIISSLQELFFENEKNSIAINLSLGINNRSSSMYDCNITHNHRHKDAPLEIEAWVQYLKKQGYSKIHLVGHSKGANQTAWFYANTKHKEVLTASLIAPSTWDKTKNNLPKTLSKAISYISSNQGHRVIKNIDFLYCKNANATADAIQGYYSLVDYFDTPTILKEIKKPTLVFIGDEDKVVSDLLLKMKKVKNKNIQVVVIKGSDHYFRDLYLEDLMDILYEFTNQ